MDKSEFLDQLRMSLSGRLEAQQVTENLRYYEDYINTQIRMGKPESEVMESLGAPRLIARTLLDAQGDLSKNCTSYGGTAEYSTGAGYEDFGKAQPGGKLRRCVVNLLAKFFAMPRNVRVFLGVTLTIVFLWVVFSILSFLIPLLLPAFVVLLLIKMFRDWLK